MNAQPYHHIVRIVGDRTKNGKLMLRCETVEGVNFNVFKDADLTRDTLRLLLEAGYASPAELKPNEVQTWYQHPIRVTLENDGKWWRLLSVEPRPKHALADEPQTINHALYKQQARSWAGLLVNGEDYPLVALDTETTGLLDDDEVVEIAVVGVDGVVLFNSRIRPRDPEKLLRVQRNERSAAEVTGITPEMLEHAKPFEDLYDELSASINGALVVAYNSAFDMGILNRECNRRGLPLLVPLATIDVARIAAQYIGEWHEAAKGYRLRSLQDVAAKLSLDEWNTPGWHSAEHDALVLVEILIAIAGGQPVREDGSDE